MELDDYLKSQVRFHLGFNAGAQILLVIAQGLKRLCRLFQTTTGMSKSPIT